MTKIRELLNAYKEANNATRAEMARGIGIPERKLRGIMTEGRKVSDTEEFLILKWLKDEQFDYIPPEAVETVETVEEPPQPKAPRKKKPIKSEGVSIRGDAKILVKFYKEAKGFKTDADAATELVKRGFMSILKEASDVE